MSKAFAKEYYERIILLRVQLFLRAVVFAGSVLILSKLYHTLATEGPLEFLGLGESYAAALATVFSVSAAAATMDIPIRFLRKRIRNRFSRKSG